MAKLTELIQKVEQGSFDATFAKLYAKNDITISKQRTRYIQALNTFGELFGKERDVKLYSAPGRTEIGGNHTDHNNGVVMAAAVNLDIIAVIAQNDDNIVHVKSKGFDSMDQVDLSVLEAQKNEFGRSAALIRGVAAGIVKEGGTVHGFDAYTTSDVLRGSGLSSSAAFEVIIGKIFSGEYNNDRFSAVDIAKISQYAENVFFNKPSGLMDQTACAVGSAITIDFKDPSTPVVAEVPFDLEKLGYALCITDTKGSHANLTDDYAAIRTEMNSVAGYYGKTVLRDINEADMMRDLPKIRAKVGDRAVVRAMHYFAECARVPKMYSAVKENRFTDFLALINACGHSSFEYNQNAYSLKNIKEQGVPLGLALSQYVLQDRGACRLQGGGFAGTIQAFVPNDLVAAYTAQIDAVFGDGSCYVLSIRNYGAVEVTATM